MKKALRDTQILRAGCIKAEPKIFCPTTDPLPGGAGWPKFNQSAADGHYLYVQTQLGED